MGVPKFFRYISERYPCLSEFVKEYQIPVFDNLYLDMNGIIHMCSHPDDNNPHFRITEEKIFADIFHYIEFLFRMIKPQKIFFMAIDGVAPRAKMNQQRGRRFRSAKDAAKKEKEALKKKEKLPEAERFDSNCITPGTEFMARLHEQLKYFVVQKVSNDRLWKKCKIILSGHETPGEGEHKIMDYIRYTRSQPGYDPNTRHCLYGLDADLIMLGLCTHDPHFSLLREEVKFGKKTKRSNVPEDIRFYLLHLSLMREYLELEFQELKNLTTPKFDIEKIIDDWILMGFLIGNDFIPNLPNLHISNGALPVLYKAYIEVLPTLDGYINESGVLNLERFEKFMRKLAEIDFKNFEETYDDMIYLKRKTGRKHEYHTSVSTKIKSDEDEIPKTTMNPELAALIQATDELDVSSEDEVDSSEDELFKQFKDEYYRNKLEFQKVTPEVMRDQAEGYVRAIQWNLHYYYNGVCSWSWFYPHHYSPYISDIKGFGNLRIDFELGKPFKPYEQLLAVLPSASKNLLPKCYHPLMTDDTSKIKDYYPEDFQTDMNGKKQEWEAVVLVPFIDENLLLDTMKPCNELLTPEEEKRNAHGPMLVYEYADEELGVYEAPSYFPKVENRARCLELKIEDLLVPREKLVKGAYPGAKFDVFYPGFPTFKHLKYTGSLKKERVKVFEMPSRNENMILELQPKKDDSAIVQKLLGKLVWVGWPHLVEAKVVAISTKSEKFISPEMEEKLKEKPNLFARELEGAQEYFMNRMGINFGNTEFLVHVQLMEGRKYVFTSGRRVTLEKQFSNIISVYPYQSVVTEIQVHDEIGTTFCEVDGVFPVGTLCYSLSNPHYGSQGTVMDSEESLKVNQIKVSLRILEEPNLSSAEEKYKILNSSYLSLANSASQLAVSNYLFSRITGSLFVSVRNGEGGFKTTNIGLDLKFTKKNQETPGYTKKVANYWMYTSKAVTLVRQYIEKFPEVFKYLSNSNDDEIMADNIFENDGDERVKEIHIWLKTLPIHNIERRVCGSLVLEQEVVNEIEKVVDETKENYKELVMLMKPQFLYKPGLQMGNLCPDPLTKTTIFDRVVNVREGITVPLGLKGTVTAIYKSSNTLDIEEDMYDIVFDKPFTGGMALNCSEQRGYRLSKISFINLTYGKRLMEQKTGVTGALRALAKERNNPNSLNINLRPPNSAFASFSKAPNHPNKSNYNNNKPPSFNFMQRQQLNPLLHTGSTGAKDSLPFVNVSRNQETRVNKENSVQQRNIQPSKTSITAKTETRTEPVKPKDTSVNTDFLKKILNIPSNSAPVPKAAPPPTNNFDQWRQIPNNPAAALQPQHKLNHLPNVCPVPNNFHTMGQFQNNHPNMRHFEPTFSNARQMQNNFQSVRPITKGNLSSPSATLLSHYQSNMLGCPRYTYLNDDKGVCAQITLPNGQVINGPMAKSREEASDRVAEQVLAIFSKIELPPRFPEPPTKWVQDKQPVTSQVYVNSAHQKTNPDTYMKNTPSSSTNARKNYAQNGKDSSNKHAFVPLQALKKKPNTPKSANRQEAQVAKKERADGAKSVPPKVDVSKAGDVKKREDRKRQARRPRIAANFQK